MVARGQVKKPYTLLDGVIQLDDELFDRLLGLVTDDPARPLSSCRPERPFKARDHFELPKKLYPDNAVECVDVNWLESQTVEEEAKVEFSKMFKLWGSHSGKKDNLWETTLLRRIEIQENPQKRLRELLSVPEYSAGIRELLEDQESDGLKREIGIITGFITCSDLKVNRETENSTSVGGGATLATEAAIGIPGANVTAETSMKKTRHKALKGAYKGEVVVACTYLPIAVNDEASKSFNIGNYLPWGKKKRRADPMATQNASVKSQAYDVGREPMKGDMSRPLGVRGDYVDEDTTDEEGEDDEEGQEAILKYVEDPDDIWFTIGSVEKSEE